MTPASVTLRLPDWVGRLTLAEPSLSTDEERLRWVIGLARRNVQEGTGGPFAAAVFHRESGRLVAAGVNQVEALLLSCAHAEVLALLLAQDRLGSFDLGAAGNGAHELVSSAQPCMMCLGAVVWSGVSRLVYGATRRDVESLSGFDEGFLARRWVQRLERRGIEVVGARLRQEAREVLRLYRERGGTVYNARRPARSG
jgi:tRNA(Arg) A34 adenosine deaminase TadA